MSTTEKTEFEAKAAESGAGATDAFKRKQRQSVEVPTERVDEVVSAILAGVHQVIRDKKVSYAEYDAAKQWLISVGEDGEWPLFLDVWVEHVVEDVATSHREGNKGSIEGPYYVPDAPEMGANGTIPMREDEPGTPLHWTGTITSTDGTPLEGKVELWHADAHGFYSQYAPGLPEWNLRGTFSTGADGQFEIDTVQPAPYQIPTDGACGKLIAAAGWHAWHPAHLHVKVSAPGHEQLTAQLYFPGDEHNDDDIASAVKPELILDPKHEDGKAPMTYNFVLDPEKA